ncbi:MAG: hypothetical protein M1826_000469 [Phylliscum demangeonii]|nr:MAG: hypothetical protein M1826_000469 [Phylliscum demangeonii]
MATKSVLETEIEKHIFGDDAGFHQGIHDHAPRRRESASDDGEEQESENDDEDLGGLADSELFFLDAGRSASPAGAALQAANAAEDGLEHGKTAAGPAVRDVPAWEDSDDERIMISLATNNRLRKLRKYEGEDMVNGKEYAQRLRRQFQLLHPVPGWLIFAQKEDKKAILSKEKSGKVLTRERGRASSGDEMDVDNNDDDDDDDDEELSTRSLADLLQDPAALTRSLETVPGKRRKLRPEVLEIQRARDVGSAQPSSVTSLSFHPTQPLLLSSGPASTLYLHRIAPSHATDPNPLLTSVHLRRTPLSTSAFQPPRGTRIYASGARRYFHQWELSAGRISKVARIVGLPAEEHQGRNNIMERFKLSPCGRWMGIVSARQKADVGVVHIINAQTTHWLAEARIDQSRGGLADFAWWGDGGGLSLAGKGGEVVEYDMGLRRVVARWMDDGAVGTTVLALGGRLRHPTARAAGRLSLGPDRWVAVGSTSGIVNIYDRASWSDPNAIAARPAPLRSLGNLTTPISHLAFSPDGQLLALASRWKQDALRLVHLPSCTVYRNWPTAQTPLGRITAVAFADYGTGGEGGGGGGGSGGDDGVGEVGLWLAVGNEAGKIRLWEIRE